MGYSNWSNTAYNRLSTKRSKQSRQQIFANNSQIDPGLDPRNITTRESRDSAEHPNSNAIVVAFDVTGSMGTIPEQFARQKLGGLMRMLVERDAIADPQLLFMGIGDSYSDQAPLQVGQFESGLEMDMWLTRIWLESGGGGQMKESYGLAHLFAAKHTTTDCFEKRGKKGYLFTMGDEKAWGVPAKHAQKILSKAPEADLSIEQVIAMAQERYEVFHIVITEGYHGSNPEVIGQWRGLLGERALLLDDTDGVCELIATTISMCEGTIDLDGAARTLRDMGVKDATVAAVTSALTPLANSGSVVSKGSSSALVPSSGSSAVERL